MAISTTEKGENTHTHTRAHTHTHTRARHDYSETRTRGMCLYPDHPHPFCVHPSSASLFPEADTNHGSLWTPHTFPVYPVTYELIAVIFFLIFNF